MNPFYLSRWRSAAGSDKGFSLVEVLIVLAIMLVFTGTALPNFINLSSRARLKSAARDVVSNMQRARASAIRDRNSWALHFDTATGTYRILSGSGGDGTWTDGNETVVDTVALADTNGVSFGSGHGARPDEPSADLSDGVSFSNNVVVFSPDGTSASGTVYLKIDGGDTFGVGSTSAAGRVKAWYHYGNGWGG